ncbi:hypothetical protein L3X38_035106 [Prunus dulcis]|uniref:Leucine-rich repeat-containing N-terminal plant-type domain-containing protein n=1 Tax=Prunus dulcis TaxID=3755 RepID=A0AAD4YXH7_PRUDU|nr:hypothetical protein L3X38_035106 [Prunus dulcis]
MKTLLHFVLFLIHLCVNVISVHGQCIEGQKSSLLQLKKSLIFDSSASSKLISRNSSTDCCSWVGVTCTSGRVVGLDISSESVSGGIDKSSSLFDLQHLQSLNLAYNGLGYGSQIPSAVGKLTNLSCLNLSYTAYSGQIPVEISRLTGLQVLDLSSDPSLYGTTILKLENPNLSLLIRNLLELTELHLDGVSISAQGTDWCQAISSSLPKLRVLSLINCTLSGPFDISLLNLHSLSVIRFDYNELSIEVPEFLSNFRNLTSLHLSECGLHGSFPKQIFQIPTLQTIDLSFNPQLQGSLPEFPKNGSLRSLVLNNANFTGLLPNSIGELKMLYNIDISSCNFTGSIPRSMEGLTQLSYVDLSSNKFNGSVPFFSMARNLTDINLSSNLLMGQINSSHWESLTILKSLELSFNPLDGTIPPSLFSLPMLQNLVLSDNQFSGQLPVFSSSISLLETLSLRRNKLEGPIPMNIFNLPRLRALQLSSNNLNNSFSLNVIQQSKNLVFLDLSHNSLSISYDDTNLSYSLFPQLSILRLASCKLRRFPGFLRNQSELYNLDLSQNQIHGEIPNWIWRLGYLAMLNLSCNSLVTLEGPFLNLTSNLLLLDLHSNQLQGRIPIFQPVVNYLDYSKNNFSFNIPYDIGDFLTQTRFFSLSNNNLHGIIPVSLCNVKSLQVLDLSSNSLSGMIPRCLSATTNLVVLNLRRNNLAGTISDKFSANCSLGTLDLGANKIGGKFPKSLARCEMLAVLNLGHNQITDVFPHLLKEISTLRVLVLRSNRFYGNIGCPKTNGTWSKLQIIDLADNHFSGEISGDCLKHGQK